MPTSSYWIIVRETAVRGKLVKKYLRRPFAGGRRWSWAERKAGCARFHSEAEAKANLSVYPTAMMVLVEPKPQQP